MATCPIELAELQAEIDAIWARSETLLARAKSNDPYWANSARQHLRNFAHAYRRAFHDAVDPPRPSEGDLF